MNQFGGRWTEAKMDIIVDYARAYLTIMNKQPWAETLYFDGFAGSGLIEVEDYEIAVKGTALRILELTDPKPFDIYYFVEKRLKTKKQLEKEIHLLYPERKNIFVTKADCNDKLKDMANYLKRNKKVRVLAFIDPFGMSVNWDSILKLKNLGIDFWILVPTGVGVNRLLKKNGDISEAWQKKLEKFLGIPAIDIKKHFYKEEVINTLFGKEVIRSKEKQTISKVGDLYKQKLKTIFNFVSEPFVMQNSTNSIMYHFMMATNNRAALKIANEVIKPKYKL